MMLAYRYSAVDRAGHPARGALVGGAGGDVLAAEHDAAGGHGVRRVREERVGEGRLPGAVRAHEGVDLAGADLFDRIPGARIDRHATDLCVAADRRPGETEQAGGHAPPSVRQFGVFLDNKVGKLLELLQRGLGARWIQVGDDFRFGARRAGDFTMLKAAEARCGFEVEALTSVTVEGVRVSSTAVRERLAAGDMEGAQKLLGRPYSISGRIVHGDGFGRKLDCPTANVLMKHNRPPVSGIFAVEVSGLEGGDGDAVLPGVASLGVRPTVTHDARPCLEVHLFDFNRDIYGRHIKVDFLHKFRDEEKYADLETLKRQIALDVENAQRYFQTSGTRKTG